MGSCLSSGDSTVVFVENRDEGSLDNSSKLKNHLEQYVVTEPDVVENDIRFLNIVSKEVKVPVGFVPPSFAKNPQQKEAIYNAIMSNFLFEDLEQFATDVIIDAMEPFEVSLGTNIITQGETGEYFYVIESGKVGFFVDNVRVNEESSGQCFGELALLYDCPRTASAVSESQKCKLWRIGQTLCKQILASQKMAAISGDMDTLTKVPLLKNLEPRYMRTIAYALQTEEYVRGDTIFSKGEVGDVFYIIKSGTIVLSDIGLGISELNDKEITAGDFFGERALLTGDVRTANATAQTDCVLMAMNGNDFMKLLGPLEDLMDETMNRQYLAEVPIIAQAKLQPNELALLTRKSHVGKINFAKDEMIGYEGEQIDTPGIYIIKSGQILSGEEVLGVGDCVCADSLINDEPTYKDTITSLGDGDEPTKCIFISLESFINILGSRRRLLNSGEATLNRKRTMSEEKIDAILSKARLEDLEKITIIGSGTFGKVWLVKHKETKNVLALKIQKKIILITHKQSKSAKREKHLMEVLDHPFIVNMKTAFQDTDNLYMLLSAYPGGELFEYLSLNGKPGLEEDVSKFFSAGVFEALDFMHMNNIVYRDLKLENIVLDSDGYGVIIDLGFAKKIVDKTYTLCGTPPYMAPEVILSRGHDKAADMWSLGVLIYELNYGVNPFYQSHMDQMALFKTICVGKFTFPKKQRGCNDLISRLLKRRAPFRIGCMKDGGQEIRKHPWFAHFHFDALRNKEIEAPWRPNPRKSFEKQHFTHSKESDSFHLELTPTQQAHFKDF